VNPQPPPNEHAFALWVLVALLAALELAWFVLARMYSG
jgi:hypothetical protein